MGVQTAWETSSIKIAYEIKSKLSILEKYAIVTTYICITIYISINQMDHGDQTNQLDQKTGEKKTPTGGSDSSEDLVNQNSSRLSATIKTFWRKKIKSDRNIAIARLGTWVRSVIISLICAQSAKIPLHYDWTIWSLLNS